MREILFKAEREDNGEWVEGQYAYINNPLTENGQPIRHLICNGTNIFNYEINPDTLCQYTGLTDKNDKKIWENDILVEKHKGIVTMKYRVVFDLEEGSWMLETKSGARYGIGAVNQRNFEACGNIFDNEELLEVE